MCMDMGDKYCQEVIVVKGDVKYIRDLTEKIKKLKGVEHVKLTSTRQYGKLQVKGIITI